MSIEKLGQYFNTIEGNYLYGAFYVKGNLPVGVFVGARSLGLVAGMLFRRGIALPKSGFGPGFMASGFIAFYAT